MKSMRFLALGLAAATLVGGAVVQANGFAGEAGLVQSVCADEGAVINGGATIACTVKYINIQLACGTVAAGCPQGTTCPGNYSIFVTSDQGSYQVPRPDGYFNTNCTLCGGHCSNSRQRVVGATNNCTVP